METNKKTDQKSKILVSINYFLDIQKPLKKLTLDEMRLYQASGRKY